jgi:hypothetical protein
LVTVILNLKLQATAWNCWDLEGSDNVPVSGHTQQLWGETDRNTHKISVMLSHATSDLNTGPAKHYCDLPDEKFQQEAEICVGASSSSITDHLQIIFYLNIFHDDAVSC